jgi:uncharacterized protein YndB with AHSA1/START domain
MSDEGTLIITRLLDAPVETVFGAWIDPEQATRWWGPKGFIPVSCTIDARVGGTWRRVMHSRDGIEHRAHGVYREIAAPSRLVFTYSWENGHETLVTLTLTARGNQTELTLRQEVFNTVAARDDHRGGWSSCLDRFAVFLAQRR